MLVCVCVGAVAVLISLGILAQPTGVQKYISSSQVDVECFPDVGVKGVTRGRSWAAVGRGATKQGGKLLDVGPGI